MSDATVHGRVGWEYRRLWVVPRPGGDDELNFSGDTARFVENLIEKVENLDGSGQQGWHLLRVSLEEDVQGRCRLNVSMKRPRFIDGQQLSEPQPGTIPLPQMASTTITEILDEPLLRLPIKKAA